MNLQETLKIEAVGWRRHHFPQASNSFEKIKSKTPSFDYLNHRNLVTFVSTTVKFPVFWKLAINVLDSYLPQFLKFTKTWPWKAIPKCWTLHQKIRHETKHIQFWTFDLFNAHSRNNLFQFRYNKADNTQHYHILPTSSDNIVNRINIFLFKQLL